MSNPETPDFSDLTKEEQNTIRAMVREDPSTWIPQLTLAAQNGDGLAASALMHLLDEGDSFIVEFGNDPTGADDTARQL